LYLNNELNLIWS